MVVCQRICHQSKVQATVHGFVCRTGNLVSQDSSLAPPVVGSVTATTGPFSFAREGMFAH